MCCAAIQSQRGTAGRQRGAGLPPIGSKIHGEASRGNGLPQDRSGSAGILPAPTSGRARGSAGKMPAPPDGVLAEPGSWMGLEANHAACGLAPCTLLPASCSTMEEGTAQPWRDRACPAEKANDASVDSSTCATTSRLRPIVRHRIVSPNSEFFKPAPSWVLRLCHAAKLLVRTIGFQHRVGNDQ